MLSVKKLGSQINVKYLSLDLIFILLVLYHITFIFAIFGLIEYFSIIKLISYLKNKNLGLLGNMEILCCIYAILPYLP